MGEVLRIVRTQFPDGDPFFQAEPGGCQNRGHVIRTGRSLRVEFAVPSTLMSVNRREFSLYAALGVAVFMTYLVTCRLVEAPTAVFMPGWVPFAPLLTMPYLLQVVVSYVLAMFIQASALRHAVFKAYFLAIAVTLAVWLAFPTTMLRPPTPGGWWNWPYAMMAGADLPVHIIPAGHILMPVLIIWAFAYERPRWLWWLIPAELVGAAGIVTTWQHRPIDVLYGVVLAIAAGVVCGVHRRRVTAFGNGFDWRPR